MSEQNTTPREEKEESVNIHALLLKYLVYWHWFAISVVVFLAVAWIYLRFQPPVYNVSAAVLIQEEDSKGMNAAGSPLSAIQDFGMFSVTNNFDNEVEVLHSRTLIKEVITTLNLYTSLSEKRVFGYATPLYRDAPLRLFMTAEEADRLESPIRLDMEYTPDGKLDVEASFVRNEEKETLTGHFEQFPAVFTTPVGVLSFMSNDSVTIEEPVRLKGFVCSPTFMAEAYSEKFTVEPTSKTTTIAQLSLKNTDKNRAVDFINTLVERYNQNANNDKNEVAAKTAEFIEERLEIINRELGNTENELASFKQRSGLTDISSNAQIALEESAKYNQQRVQNETQISIVKFLRDYINNPKNANEVIPSNVGVEDQKLSTAVEQYNTLLGERKRLLLTSSEENPAVKKIDVSLDAMRRSVQATVAASLRSLQIAKADIDRQATKFEGRISQAPEQEKEFMSIARQQEIKATLYTMLLQKREENAITLAATANNGRIIEEALPDIYPVSPKKKMIYLAALILGIALPVGIIYVRDLLKYRIENREDVEKITKVPVIGEIPLEKKPERGAIVIQENRNDMMEEVFRGVRTNLLFMLKSDERVIMFTSTMPGEGKSFVAGNIAVSLAFMGKKVVIVGLDIRKPGLNKVFNLSKRVAGITNYLSDPDHTDLFDMIQPSDISENLDILPGGPVPPNPTELVARTTLEDVVETLKQHYDYIILDTAPIGMVTDSALIARVANALVYVCRADYTPKGGYGYINTLKNELKFSALCTVLNGIDLTSRKNSYSYGYGKKYGYGYGKRYGYGYETEKKK